MQKYNERGKELQQLYKDLLELDSVIEVSRRGKKRGRERARASARVSE